MLQSRESQRDAWLTELMLKPLNTYFYILGLCIQSAGLNSNVSHREKARTKSKHLNGRRPLDALRGLGSVCGWTRAAAVGHAWEDAVLPPHRQARRVPAAPLWRGQGGNHFTLTSSPAHQPEAELISKL